MSRRVLLVEDEAPIRDMLSFVLEQSGFETIEAEDYDIAQQKLVEPYPDLILLDWMLPGGSGVQLAKSLKQHEFTRDIPVIMLTARGEEDDKIRGLDAGADDYITKPFSPKELVARIKAVMRRVTPTSNEQPIEFNGLKLEPISHRVMANDEALDMGPTVYKLLHFFIRSGCIVVNNCSTMFGVPMSTWKIAPWMCISAAYVKPLVVRDTTP